MHIYYLTKKFDKKVHQQKTLMQNITLQKIAGNFGHNTLTYTYISRR